MYVDDTTYLPRLMHDFYRADTPVESGPVWAPFDTRLAASRIALLSSAGLHLRSEQPFDLARERGEPTWGDASYRMIPHTVEPEHLAMAHLHLAEAPLLADPNIALPVQPLDDLVAEGTVGGAVTHHVSVMGYQGWRNGALDRWRHETAPAIVGKLRAEGADGVVLAPA